MRIFQYTIKKQNKFDGTEEGFYIGVVKKIIKERRDNMCRERKKEDCIILEVVERIHELILRKEKINTGERKCKLNYRSACNG